MGTPILAVAEWPFLIIVALGIVLWITWYPFRSQLRAANLAYSEGDLSRSLEETLRTHRSWLPWALWEHLHHPGLSQAMIAARHLGLGEALEARQWCDRGLKVAKKPNVRSLLLFTHAEASAFMGDSASQDQQLANYGHIPSNQLGPGLSWHLVAAACYSEGGAPEKAMPVLAEFVQTTADRWSPALMAVGTSTLAALGRFEEVCRLADHPSVSPSSLHSPPSGKASSSMDASFGLDQIRTAGHRTLKSYSTSVILSAAAQTNRWDVYERLMENLSILAESNRRLRAGAHGYEMIWAAHLGDEDSVRRHADELNAIIGTIPRDRQRKAEVELLAARAWQLLRRDDLALQHLQKAEEARPAPLDRSLISARIAECLDALGRGEEAEPYREQARRLAPQAWWNHPEPDPEIDEQAAAILNAWSQPPEERRSSIEMETSQEPVEPVASRLAWAVWILAVIAMFPASGALAALPLLACAVVLITRRHRRAHDRRVGWAGIILATLSIASSAFLVHAHRVGFERLSAIAATSWEDDPSLPALTPPNDTNPKPTTTHESQQASEPADEDGESQLVASVPDVRSGPNWSYSTSAVWQLKVLFLAVLILSIIPHEVGHGVAALWCGDPTARDQRRLSLNPLRHVSWLGSVFVPLLLVLMPGCSIWIGWAKPVPIQPQRFRARRWGQIAVSLSGVSMNLLLAAVAANVLTMTLAVAEVWYHGGLATSLFDAGTLTDVANVPSPAVWGWIVDACRVILLINTVLVVFNLIPLPPLDGFLLIRSVVPSVISNFMTRLSLLGFAVFIFLVVTGHIAWLAMPAVYLVTPLLFPAYLLDLL